MVTAIFYHFLAPEGGHPTREGNFFEKYIKLQGPSFRERSGRMLDSRPRGRGFEPHRRHCVVVLEQDTFILT